VTDREGDREAAFLLSLLLTCMYSITRYKKLLLSESMISIKLTRCGCDSEARIVISCNISSGK
jgi:hypothetical protein